MLTTAEICVEKEFGKVNPLDESLYDLDEEGLAFMRTQTGIEDEAELKKHVLAVQAEAYKVRSFGVLPHKGIMLTARHFQWRWHADHTLPMLIWNSSTSAP